MGSPHRRLTALAQVRGPARGKRNRCGGLPKWMRAAPPDECQGLSTRDTRTARRRTGVACVLREFSSPLVALALKPQQLPRPSIRHECSCHARRPHRSEEASLNLLLRLRPRARRRPGFAAAVLEYASVVDRDAHEVLSLRLAQDHHQARAVIRRCRCHALVAHHLGT